MKYLYSIVFFITTLCTNAQELNGEWKGRLNLGSQELTLILHIDKITKTVTMDVVEQGAKALPSTVNILTSDSLNFGIQQLGISYSGKVEEGKLTGIFQQHMFSMPLTFEPGSVELNRPQEPKPPFPYRTEEVLFWNYPDKAMLAGTLTYPIGYVSYETKVPVVVMVSGSGQQNRDEEVFGHKPFLVIADWLARHGIASLRYDDRGVGGSLGDASMCTTREFCFDANAAVDYLRLRHEFSSIGVLGHSEGGSIGYMLGSENQVDFIVSLAGPACRIDEMMVVQINGIAHVQGMTEKLVHSPQEAHEFMVAQNGNSEWLSYFMSLDMTRYVEKVECPVLALGGESDLNVPVSINLAALKAHLPKNKKNVIKTYPGLSHFFQHNPTGNPTLIMSIEETISEEVLKDISDFINGLH